MTDQHQPDQDQLERAFEYYPRLREVKEYVEEHIDEAHTLAEVAQLVCLQPSSFSRFFRKHTGITFIQWLNAARIKEAQALISLNNYNLTDVAGRVGYSSLRSFQRNFQVHAGMTAREYRDMIRRSIK